MNTRSLFLIFLVIGLMCGSASAIPYNITVSEDTTEYWTPTPGKHYIGIPETWTWTEGAFVHNYTYGQILPEDAPERVTGVEVMP